MKGLSIILRKYIIKGGKGNFSFFLSFSLSLVDDDFLSILALGLYFNNSSRAYLCHSPMPICYPNIN